MKEAAQEVYVTVEEHLAEAEFQGLKRAGQTHQAAIGDPNEERPYFLCSDRSMAPAMVAAEIGSIATKFRSAAK